MAREQPHLWDADHPYYCAEGNFYKAGQHSHDGTWAEFYDQVRDWDPDMNLLFRWDWFPTPKDVEELDLSEESARNTTLQTFWVGQRKASLWSMECTVTEADEPAVRAWLEERAKTITAIWAPITLDAGPDS